MSELEQEMGHLRSAPAVPKALKTHSGVSVAPPAAAASTALTSTPPSGDPGVQLVSLLTADLQVVTYN